MAGNGVEGRPDGKLVPKTDMNNGLLPPYAVPTTAATSLRCSLCSYYLSVPPVYIISEDGSRYRCGRCAVRTPFKVRATAYETLAKGTAFPCSYDGCDERLTWDDVKKHEIRCERRKVPCVSCDKDVRLDGLVEHLERSHDSKQLRRGGGVFATFDSCSYGLRVLDVAGELYAVVYDCDHERLGVEVAAYRGVADKQYTLRLSSPSSKYSITIAEQEMVTYDERLHCSKCLKGLCRRESHTYSSYRRGVFGKIPTKLPRYLLRKTLGSKTFECSIDVVEQPEDSYLDDLLHGKEMIVEEDDDDDDDDEEPMMQDDSDGRTIEAVLRCAVCTAKMVPPMHECVTGHTMCGECRGKCGEKCPKCGGAVEGTRNYALEELAASLKLMRDESKLSNNAAASSLEKEIVCPTSKCFDKIRVSKIGEHFKACHPTNYHSSKFSIRNVYAYCNVDVLVKDDKTYVVLFDFDDDTFGISMCCLEGDERNRYEVKLSSSDGKYAVQAVRQRIVPFNDKEHCFKCSLGNCKDSDHTYRKRRSEAIRRLTTRLDRDSVRRLVPTARMNYSVRLRRDAASSGASRLVAAAYKCAACEAPLVSPPFRQCLAGHTICATHAGSRCPSCEARVASTRNLALEAAREGEGECAAKRAKRS